MTSYKDAPINIKDVITRLNRTRDLIQQIKEREESNNAAFQSQVDVYQTDIWNEVFSQWHGEYFAKQHTIDDF